MKKSRYTEETEEQIIGFLKQAEAGMPIKELCCKGSFSDATFYKWRAGKEIPARAIKPAAARSSPARTRWRPPGRWSPQSSLAVSGFILTGAVAGDRKKLTH